MDRPTVGIKRISDVDDPEQVHTGMFDLLDLLQERIQVPRHARVLIKINLCLLLGSETGATVDPYLVRYLVEWLLERRDIAEVILAEADATALDADLAYRVLGWDLVFSDLPKARFLNLSHDERVSVRLDGLLFKNIEMSKTFMEADYLISFAKLKTHTIEIISGVMKNQFGAMPEKLKIAYHPHLSQAIFDMTRVRMPNLCIVDGLIGQEGAGPVNGVPRLMGLVIAGTDPMATDQVSARLMGKDPRQVPHLRLAIQHHLADLPYEARGCRVEDVRAQFAFVPRWQQAWQTVRGHIIQAKS